jgi:glycosyltransferase involved in cell wall biosynthesis
MATLSLCIPAFNAGHFLPRLLRSAINQEVPFDEILVYDDCSTDDTALVAKKYGAKIISGDINRGCSFGKNKLAAATNCDWIHFHDADDDILPLHTKNIHEWLIANSDNFEVLLLNFRYVDFHSGRLIGMPNYNAEELRADPLKYTINHKIVNFGVYKREAFLNAGGFDLDEKVLYNEDNAVHQRLAKSGLRFDYLSEVTCINYRYRESMSASNQLKCAQANFHVLEKTASSHGHIYPLELSKKIWACIAGLAAFQDWEYVKKALAISNDLGYRYSPDGSKAFQSLTRVNPFFAVWFREKMIRFLKPHLRKNE